MKERNWQSDAYRFGFNDQEKDDEIYGEGNTLAFEARIYNAILGRWFSLDPLQAKYPGFSPYAFCGDSPIYMKDVKGKYGVFAIEDNRRLTMGSEGHKYRDFSIAPEVATLLMNYYYHSGEIGQEGGISKADAAIVEKNIRDNLDLIKGEMVMINNQLYVFDYDISFIDVVLFHIMLFAYSKSKQFQNKRFTKDILSIKGWCYAILFYFCNLNCFIIRVYFGFSVPYYT